MHSRLYAVCAAGTVATLVLTVLVVVDAALAWGTIGLWGLPVSAAIAIGGVGGLAACWAAWRIFRSAYGVERAAIDHVLPRAGNGP